MPSPSGSAAVLKQSLSPPVEFTLYVRRLIGPVAVHVHVDFNASKSANGLRLFAGPPFVRGSAHIAIEASGTISGTAIGRNFGNGFALTSTQSTSPHSSPAGHDGFRDTFPARVEGVHSVTFTDEEEAICPSLVVTIERTAGGQFRPAPMSASCSPLRIQRYSMVVSGAGSKVTVQMPSPSSSVASELPRPSPSYDR